MLQDHTPTGGGHGASTATVTVAPRPTVADHRRVVVRRLLARGLSPHALEQILPGWLALLQQGVQPVGSSGRG